MTTVWVKEYTGGLDTRKMAVSSPGGTLIEASDGHINRGAEFEKRAAFVERYVLPAGTKSLAATQTSLVVFGSAARPAGLNSELGYQRLQHPTNAALELSRVISTDLYSGKVYAVAEFSDGSIHHYFNGVYVSAWFDGRARMTFTVTEGSLLDAQPAFGYFEVTGGSVGTGNQLTNLAIGGVNVIAGPVAYVTDNGTTALAIANAINSHTSSPDYTAVANGTVVTVTASVAGTSANGRVISPTIGGTVVIANVFNMAGGTDADASRLDRILVNGINAMGARVLWRGSHAETAAAIAEAINLHISDPNYTATSRDAQVTLLAPTAGTDTNGFSVQFILRNGMQVSPSPGSMQGGSVSSNAYEPGRFVKTIGSKVYATSGPNLHFSGIDQPTKWSPDVIGAGFIDISRQESGSEALQALSKYQNLVAVFAERVIQIFFVDSNPVNNKQSQVLRNTGTASPRSVTQFGDSDLFYLDESGLRSLRARDASNAAATTDIGVPVDSLITAKLRAMVGTERTQIFGLIEPQDGRFWLIMLDRIFVFSYFPGSKISAWSFYNCKDVGGAAFVVDDAVVHRRRVYLRAGNRVLAYGGTATDTTYDSTVAVAGLPFLDAGAPTLKKMIEAIDAAVEGQWDVSMRMDPRDLNAMDPIGTIFETSFNGQTIPLQGSASHFAPIFKSRGTGPAKLGPIVLHFKKSADED